MVRRRAIGRRGGAALTAFVAAVAVAAPAGAADSPMPLQTGGVLGFDYTGGVLSTVEKAPNGSPYVTNRQISADGSKAGERDYRGFAGTLAGGRHVKEVACDAGWCVPLRGAGNGDVGYFSVDGGKESAQLWLSENSLNGADEPAVTGGRFIDYTGRYYIYNATSTGKQYVDATQELRSQNVRLTRSITAASVWGQRLWTPGSGAGTVTAYDLERKRTVETIATGAPCTVKELQVVSRWIYWNCGPTGAAGAYDRVAKRKITVPSGPALVGDGYLVRHDRTAGKLLLTDFHAGTAAAPREIADLPAGNTADQRRLTWSVDKFGGDIAYVDAGKVVHVVQSGVPSQPLAVIESDVDDDDANAKNDIWASTWQLSKPTAWTLALKDARGRVVRTLTGTGTEVAATWDGKTDTGTYAYNGAYTWALTAKATEGTGTYTQSGALGLAGARTGHHDLGGYSYGELVTLNSSGALTVHYTRGRGTLDFRYSASGWPAGTTVIPFGDMGADRCAELLVRMPNGELRRYAGNCGGWSYGPGSNHASLGTGWNAYNVLTAPGDLTGDGRTDLLARKASTGDMYLFANNGAGKFRAGVKVGSAWNGYTRIVGAGDLTGDGFGDVLARDTAGSLWRYDGAGDGTLKARVKILSQWGATYNAVVGVGDITGDGRNDLVVRDTAGNLFRNPGLGNGSFAPRVKIGSGWQGYKGLY
ncbi:FG-GAP-like repeat-containing protein [Streptomyces sp. ME02-8801-2C]|uniref:FG-GAP-like repeat-containing protein n=1 Tax=Streptomyces sp. ME02-8801-2C TaxID=3028680 RepID=UPI0029BF721B|nr:FG-GAP-like repeat-containing protein [Streptomyces sp. ME02-8801-2C]MDX3457988.1 FG-GAP-like repeat-containing protein [Streptomyces sp. ME02-8801-2C]